MAYETFGEHAQNSPDEVIKKVQKRKNAEEATYAALSPLRYAILKGAKLASTSGKVINDEDYIRAILIKCLEEKGLYPPKIFKRNLKATMRQIVKDEMMPAGHPFWTNPALKNQKNR